jgi:Rhs element Vgr protein
MPTNELFGPSVVVKINGSDLSPAQLQTIESVEVDSSLYLPSMLAVRFFAPNVVQRVEPATQSLDSIAKVGNPIEVAATISGGGQASPVTQVIFKGEVTAIEGDFQSDGFGAVTVRAYDKGHRLMRKRSNKVLKQIQDSAIISQLASAAGLSATVAATSESHPYVIQGNQTDYEFMRDRALRNGQAMWVDGDAVTTKKWSEFSSTDATLKFMEQLIEFRPRVTSIGQATSVSVRGWDPKTKAAIVANATSPSLMNTIGSRTVNDLSTAFTSDGAGVVHMPMVSTAEATSLAQATLDGGRGGDVQAEGLCHGDPRILAGKRVEIKGLSSAFDGKYLITRAVHRFNADGYHTSIESTNGTGETLADLVVDAPPQQGAQKIFGMVIGVVTDNNDPESMGRVKVKFPWMMNGDSIESNWARVVAPMAGASRGFLFLPEVNDEVLVGFEHGDPNFPYVMGALWNGSDAPPLTDAVANGKVVKRQIKTRAGHLLTFDDTEGSEKIEIIDKSGKNSITISSSDNSIAVVAEGDVSVTAKGGVTVDATKDVSVKSQAKVEVQSSAGMTLKTDGQMQIQGAMVQIKGNMVQIN